VGPSADARFAAIVETLDELLVGDTGTGRAMNEGVKSRGIQPSLSELGVLVFWSLYGVVRGVAWALVREDGEDDGERGDSGRRNCVAGDSGRRKGELRGASKDKGERL